MIKFTPLLMQHRMIFNHDIIVGVLMVNLIKQISRYIDNPGYNLINQSAQTLEPKHC